MNVTVVWDWIDPNQIELTQNVHGHRPPNLLEPLAARQTDEHAAAHAPSDPPVPPEASTSSSYSQVVADSQSPARTPTRARSPARSPSPYTAPLPLYSSPYPGTGASASGVMDSAPPSPSVVLPLQFPEDAGVPEDSLLLGPAHTTSYHIRSQLSDGRPALLIDPGSVGNLCGDRWAEAVARAAKRAGRTPTYEKRSTPLNVSGVGHGSQKCIYDCTLPVSLNRSREGAEGREGSIVIPSVQHSDLPGLLGLNTLRYNRAVLDFTTLEMHFLGPGDSKVGKTLPPGSDTFQLEIAPSGHLVLPCSEFKSPPPKDTSLTLLSTSETSSSSGHTRVCPPVEEILPRDRPLSPTSVHPPQAPLTAPKMMTMGKEPAPPPDIFA